MRKKSRNYVSSSVRPVHSRLLSFFAIAAIMILAMFITLIVMPAMAFADDGASGTSISRVTTDVLNVLLPIFVAFIGGLATWGAKKVLDKLHITLADSVMDQWSALAEKAAMFGAEYARKKAKELTDGKKVPGPEVLEAAASWAVSMGESMKLPDMAGDALKGLIESHLFKLRMDQTASNVQTASAAGSAPSVDVTKMPTV
jgi:hypothetical protein